MELGMLFFVYYYTVTSSVYRMLLFKHCFALHVVGFHGCIIELALLEFFPVFLFKFVCTVLGKPKCE
jgi:hypothetical protein